MDILQAYEKNQPKVGPPSMVQTQGQLVRQRYAPDTGFFVRLVIKLSGGRIQDARRASVVLLALAAFVLTISVAIFVWPTRSQNLLPDNFLKIDQSQYQKPEINR